MWDIDQGVEILTLAIEDGVTTVAMSPDGTFVAAGSLDKSVRVWDTRGGHLYERLDGADGHKDSVYSVAFAPTGRELVSGSLDKTIKMWELGEHRPLMGHSTARGTCLRTFEGHKVCRPLLVVRGYINISSGLCPKRSVDYGWQLGAKRLKRSRGAVLGPSYG